MHDDDDPNGSPIKIIEQSNLTLICIVGIKDIIRSEVPTAVK